MQGVFFMPFARCVRSSEEYILVIFPPVEYNGLSLNRKEKDDFPMKKIWMAALTAALIVFGALSVTQAEVQVTAVPAEVPAGGIVDVSVAAGDGAASVTYTLTNNGAAVFHGKEDKHFQSAFRPREEGHYVLEAEVLYEDGTTETGSAEVTVSGFADEAQGPDVIYSQKDGWWKDKPYGKSEMDNAGCAIFTLSHALQRMNWTGENIAPENLAETYRKCYTKNGTAVARLIFNASQDFGYTTKNILVKEQNALREGLRNGDFYSMGIVIGHIALMTGVDEKAGKVHIVDSAPSATFERIKKGKIYCLKDGEYVEVQDPGEIPGSRYYFETRFYGGLEYYLDLSYCARRGGRLIRPTWLFYMAPEGKIGAAPVSFSSGESEIQINGSSQTVLTRDLSWGTEGKPRLAVVTQKKSVKLLNEAGKRIANVPSCTVLPVLQEEEDRVLAIYGEQRGYLKLSDVEVTDPLQGDISYGTISVKGNTSGRATVKLRFGPSEKEKVMENWKTGTRVILIRQENEFWQVEAKGLRLWVHQDYITAGE